jgi:hypothetical protein
MATLFPWLSMEVGYDLKIIYDLWVMSEGQLTPLRTAAEEKAEELYHKLGFEAYEEARGEILDRFDFSFPRLLRYAFLTMLYSSSEHAIRSCARDLQRERNQTLKIDEIRGNFFDQANTYFKKVLNLPLATESPEWRSLQRLRVLRNAIVHHNGHWDYISKGNQDKINSWIEEDSRISCISGDLTFERGFCVDLYTDVEKWVDALVEQVEDVKREKMDQPQGSSTE